MLSRTSTGVLHNLGPNKHSYAKLSEALEARFASPNQTELHRVQLKERKAESYWNSLWIRPKFNPLPNGPILDSSSSTANKDMMSKMWTNGDTWYLIVENIVEKEKLLVTSNFSFSHNVFKSSLFLMRQNEYLWSKGIWRLTNMAYPMAPCDVREITCWQKCTSSCESIITYVMHMVSTLFTSEKLLSFHIFKNNPLYIPFKKELCFNNPGEAAFWKHCEKSSKCR